jgi:hypothetical protein
MAKSSVTNDQHHLKKHQKEYDMENVTTAVSTDNLDMKCESCRIRPVEIELPVDHWAESDRLDPCEYKPYKLCHECKERLIKRALRPLEVFNLVAIHGQGGDLHDDFYDYETGEADQPKMDVIDPEKFPFPKFEEVKDNLKRLVDYALVVPCFKDNTAMAQLQKFDKAEILDMLDQKIKYTASIGYEAHLIITRVVGRVAENWVRKQLENRKPEYSIFSYADLIENCLEFEEAFELLTNALEKSDDRTFNEKLDLTLMRLRSEKMLDFLETNVKRLMSANPAFGRSVARCQFSWQRCEKWLDSGRPLSLIALDALYWCTAQDDERPIRFRKPKPRLTDHVNPEIIASKLRDYLKIDSVPRTKNAVESILYNLFGTT